MKIEINIPDEAIQRIENALKSEARMLARKQGKDVQFKSEGGEFIQQVLQAKIDNLFENTDPDFIEAKKAARKIMEDGQKATKAKLEALKK